MGTLILDRPGLALRDQGEVAGLYQNDAYVGRVPLKLVDQVVVHGGQVSLDAGVLGRVCEAGGMGVLFSGRHSRRVALVLGPSHHDVRARLAQARAVTDAPAVQAWARQVVRGKLRQQALFLGRALAARPDLRHALLGAQRHVQATALRLQALGEPAQAANPAAAVAPPAADALGLATVRGLEGAAAAVYFKAYGQLLAPSLGFTGRNRRPPKDPVNACLSLAYTLLNAQAVQCAHAAGLDPLLGLYHRPAHGRASLAADLIEPLRALADEWVWLRWREQVFTPAHFGFDGPACLLTKAGRGVFYPAFVPLRQVAERWLRRVCRQLVRHWREQGQALLPELADDWNEQLEEAGT